VNSIADAIDQRWRRWRGDGARVAQRWVVLDTETSGLDPARDRLLSIGAVAVDPQGILLGDSLEVVLHNDRAGDRHNIAVHGIGYGAQSEGMPLAQALEELIDYVADAPCAGFHCAFDQAVLANAATRAGVTLPRWHWLDVAALAGALDAQRYRDGCRDLDGWLAATGIEVAVRHNAAADALATAELLLHLRARAEPRVRMDFAALAKTSRQQRWLAGGD
jgi:DNA polymerase-3 subunit epsilon